MIKILLVCSEGMSTSLLAKKIKEAAVEKNIEIEVDAVSSSAAKQHVNEYDCIILGPQIRFLLNKIQSMVKDKTKPIYAADMRHYGTVNGKALLEDALKRMGK